MTRVSERPSVASIREHFVHRHGFLPRAFPELEPARPWPKVRQIACLEEALKHAGEFVANDIAGPRTNPAQATEIPDMPRALCRSVPAEE